MNNVLMEHMIDWDRILMEEKISEEEENKFSLISNLPGPRQRVSTLKIKNSNRNVSYALSPQSGRSRKNSANRAN